mmetsp:Transcript_18796/g.54340  ORF Transcript_18796/g.54340 Transcript_18796/m.54340 type:complete len:593 (+) Transcript_18796:3-1781(+)
MERRIEEARAVIEADESSAAGPELERGAGASGLSASMDVVDDLSSSSDLARPPSSVLCRRRAFEGVPTLAEKSPPLRPTSAMAMESTRSTSSSPMRPPPLRAFSPTTGPPPPRAPKRDGSVTKASEGPALIPLPGTSASSTPPPSWPPPVRAFSPSAVHPLPRAQKGDGATADAAKGETHDDAQSSTSVSDGRTCPLSPAMAAEDLGMTTEPSGASATSVVARARVFGRIAAATGTAPTGTPQAAPTGTQQQAAPTGAQQQQTAPKVPRSAAEQMREKLARRRSKVEGGNFAMYPATGDRADRGDFATPPAAGDKAEREDFTTPPAIGDKSELGDLAMPPATGDKPDRIDFAIPPSTGEKTECMDLTIPPATGDKTERLDLVMPPATGEKAESRDLATPPPTGDKPERFDLATPPTFGGAMRHIDKPATPRLSADPRPEAGAVEIGAIKLAGKSANEKMPDSGRTGGSGPQIFCLFGRPSIDGASDKFASSQRPRFGDACRSQGVNLRSAGGAEHYCIFSGRALAQQEALDPDGQAGEADDCYSESVSATDSMTPAMSPAVSAHAPRATKPPSVPSLDLSRAAFAFERSSAW